MKRFFSYIRETVVAGLFLLLPLVVLLMLLGKLWHMVHGLISQVTGSFGEHKIAGLTLVVVFTVAVLLLLCFVAGILIRLTVISNFQGWLEKNVLRFIPGYSYLKIILIEKMTRERTSRQMSVLVKVCDAWQPGLLVEQQGDYCTVYVPAAPQADSGHIYLVNNSQVYHLHISLHDFQEGMEHFGKGFQPPSTINQV